MVTSLRTTPGYSIGLASSRRPQCQKNGGAEAWGNPGGAVGSLYPPVPWHHSTEPPGQGAQWEKGSEAVRLPTAMGYWWASSPTRAPCTRLLPSGGLMEESGPPQGCEGWLGITNPRHKNTFTFQNRSVIGLHQNGNGAFQSVSKKKRGTANSPEVRSLLQAVGEWSSWPVQPHTPVIGQRGPSWRPSCCRASILHS